MEKKENKPIQMLISTGSGKTYSTALMMRHLYGDSLRKKIIVNPDGSIKVEEVKKEEKPKETKKGWRNYSDTDKDKNKRGWVK